jgi:X-linked retinitis pigmentosa GTPase regulator
VDEGGEEERRRGGEEERRRGGEEERRRGGGIEEEWRDEGTEDGGGWRMRSEEDGGGRGQSKVKRGGQQKTHPWRKNPALSQKKKYKPYVTSGPTKIRLHCQIRPSEGFHVARKPNLVSVGTITCEFSTEGRREEGKTEEGGRRGKEKPRAGWRKENEGNPVQGWRERKGETEDRLRKGEGWIGAHSRQEGGGRREERGEGGGGRWREVEGGGGRWR